jgi:hypothetical protein
MTTEAFPRTEYIKREYGALVGKTVKIVRPLLKEECEDIGWEHAHMYEAMVIIFTDGTALIPMCDPEGNGAGHLLLTKTEIKALPKIEVKQ